MRSLPFRQNAGDFTYETWRGEQTSRSCCNDGNPTILIAESVELSWSQKLFQGSQDSSSTGEFCHFRHQNARIYTSALNARDPRVHITERAVHETRLMLQWRC